MTTIQVLWSICNIKIQDTYLHQLKIIVPYKNMTNVHHVFDLLPPTLFSKHSFKNSFLYKFYIVPLY
jgi:hypothetical protein